MSSAKSRRRRAKLGTKRLGVLWRGRDAVLRGDDPWPFLLLHHLQVPSLLARSLAAGRDWVKVDFNIGKIVEVGGV